MPGLTDEALEKKSSTVSNGSREGGGGRKIKVIRETIRGFSE